MKQNKLVRSAYPVYAIALVWIFATFVVGINTFWGYFFTVAVSAAAFFAARAIFPDQVIQVEVPPPPVDPAVAQLQQERERAIAELGRLNENMEDQEISRKVDHIQTVTGKIFDHVTEHPDKRTVVRRFLDYYLPTTIELLNRYDRLDSLGVTGENITAAKEKIRAILDTVSTAFDKQLDSLFQDEYMDISAEITVLEQMIRQEGLTGTSEV